MVGCREMAMNSRFPIGRPAIGESGGYHFKVSEGIYWSGD